MEQYQQNAKHVNELHERLSKTRVQLSASPPFYQIIQIKLLKVELLKVE